MTFQEGGSSSSTDNPGGQPDAERQEEQRGEKTCNKGKDEQGGKGGSEGGEEEGREERSQKHRGDGRRRSEQARAGEEDQTRRRGKSQKDTKALISQWKPGGFASLRNNKMALQKYLA